GPSTILDPDTSLGNCWAFTGSTGYVVVQLSNPVIPEAFSIDHVHESISPDFSSAPREFQVVGYEFDSTDGKVLGKFEYKKGKGAVQTFPVKEEKSFLIYKLHILSNYGNKDFTCLYRLRIHGKRINQI